MFVASFLSLRHREAALEGALRDELRAHAVTLAIALEENYSAGRGAGAAQHLIDRLRENTKIFAVLLFDPRGDLLALSQPETTEIFRHPPELAQVLRSGEAAEFARTVDGNKFVSIISPIKIAGENGGAIEIVKPLALVEADIFQARVNWLSTTLLLLAVIFLTVFLVLRNNLLKPINGLVAGAEALGGGDLNYRVEIPPTKDELARLAAEFNRMAKSLAVQKLQTEREAENRLELEKQLRHSERLASVGRLAAGVAHELGAPLNVIDARAEQLLEKSDLPPEKQKRNLQIIRANGERIAGLVRQLLNLARPYNLRLAPIDLSELTQATLEQIAENARKQSIKIEFAGERRLFVQADQDYLRQVLLNVLLNALQAMPGGGTLKIEIGEERRNAQPFAAIKISDTGAGIAPEHLEMIFDPFYTTKDIGQGTGLGLAVAARIVEEHDGAINAANNENGGAIFTICLPMKNSES